MTAIETLMTAFTIPVASVPDLSLIPFSILRLSTLTAWIYLCFFLVQKMQYSPLIRPRYRTVAMLMTLLTGPLCMGTLVLVAAIRRYREGGSHFIQTLRSVLRQDPDVICVGEIRDEETAEIALRAAQTGHLVLATLHC